MINKKMALKDDQLALLDLLHRKFFKAEPKIAKSKVKIPLYLGDLKRMDLFSEAVSEVLKTFENDGIKTLSEADEDEINGHFYLGNPAEEPPCFIVELPADFLEIRKRLKRSIESEENPTLGMLEFDPQTGVLSCGKLHRKFQLKSKRGSLPLRVFRILWEQRKYNKQKGESFLPERLAVQLELVDSNRDYARNTRVKDQLEDAIKTIRKKLKEFPAKMVRENGFQLVVE